MTFDKRRIYINSIISIYTTAVRQNLREDWNNVIIKNTQGEIEMYSSDVNTVILKYKYSKDSGYTHINVRLFLGDLCSTQLKLNGIHVIREEHLSDTCVRYKDYYVFLSKDDMKLLKRIPPYMIQDFPK